MLTRVIVRRAVTSAAVSGDKELLMKLRKSTGYSFQNCRKAVEKFGDDLSEAEKWLRQKAVEEGWSKLGTSRQTAAGLVGLLLADDRRSALMLEMNCETDFVAKNEKFRQLVANACRSAYDSRRDASTNESSPFFKFVTDGESAIDAELKTSAIGDFMAEGAGQLGEKLSMSRLLYVRANHADCRLCGYVHPKTNSVDGVSLGQIGALVILHQPEPAAKNLLSLGTMLCQHIVGMNPTSIGKFKPKKSDESKSCAENPIETKKTDDIILATTFSDDTELLNQDFLIQPEIKVGEYLESNGMKLRDFVRFKCGEKV